MLDLQLHPKPQPGICCSIFCQSHVQAPSLTATPKAIGGGVALANHGSANQRATREMSFESSHGHQQQGKITGYLDRRLYLTPGARATSMP